MSSEGAREGSTQGSGVDTWGVGNGRIGMNTTGWNDDVRGEEGEEDEGVRVDTTRRGSAR